MFFTYRYPILLLLCALMVPDMGYAHGLEGVRFTQTEVQGAALLFACLVGLVVIWLSAAHAIFRILGKLIVGLSLLAVSGLLGGAFFMDEMVRFSQERIIILAIFAFAALLTGFWVSVQALRESVGEKPHAMRVAMHNNIHAYGLVARFFHWSIAFLILLLVPLGFFMGGDGYSFPSGALYMAHKSLGMTVLFLAGFRLLWLLFSPPPDPFSEISMRERRASRFVHIMLYLIIIAWPLSGFLMSSYFDHGTKLFFIQLPHLVEPDRMQGKQLAFMHKEVFPYLFFALIGLHIGGVLKHYFWDRHKDFIKRMLG